jgi:hypothetical protein
VIGIDLRAADNYETADGTHFVEVGCRQPHIWDVLEQIRAKYAPCPNLSQLLPPSMTQEVSHDVDTGQRLQVSVDDLPPHAT